MSQTGKTTVGSPQKIIELVRCYGWGDILMSTALFDGLKANGYRIRYITSEPFSQLVSIYPQVDEIVTIPVLRIGSPWRMWTLNQAVDQATLALPKAQKRVCLTNVPNNNGLRRFLLRYAQAFEPWVRPKTHTLVHFAKQAGLPVNRDLSCPLPTDVDAWGKAYENAILVQLFSSQPQKDWPLEQWEALVTQIRSVSPETSIYALGSPKDPVLPWIEKLPNPSMPHALSAVQHCRQLIAVDSVFNHACAAFNRQGIILWGPTIPGVYGYESNVNLPLSSDVDTVFKQISVGFP